MSKGNRAAIILSWVLSALALVGCEGGDHFQYEPGNPVAIRAFLVEQNILRLQFDGSVDQKQTTLAMMEWSRINMSHVQDAEDESQIANDSSLDVMTLIERSRGYGYLIVHGCWGATSVFKELLGAVGIEVVDTSLELAGGNHSRAEFPALGRTTLHMDDLYQSRHSTRNDLPTLALIPRISSLAPYLLKLESGLDGWRKWNTEIADRYLPDEPLFLRALIGRGQKGRVLGGYGNYPTAEEVREADENESSFALPIVDEKVLRRIDAEIDRLGGVDAALETLSNAIDQRTPKVDAEFLRGERDTYIPLAVDEFYPEEE